VSQLSLGELIALLSAADQTKPVVFDFPSTAPTRVDSSRGWYDHPALGWGATGYSGQHQEPSVAAVVEELRTALRGSYEGWKGGTYRYRENSPLWVDNRGDWSATYITGINTDGYAVVLLTERRDD
jgi:hypothetical protein